MTAVDVAIIALVVNAGMGAFMVYMKFSFDRRLERYKKENTKDLAIMTTSLNEEMGKKLEVFKTDLQKELVKYGTGYKYSFEQSVQVYEKVISYLVKARNEISLIVDVSDSEPVKAKYLFGKVMEIQEAVEVANQYFLDNIHHVHEVHRGITLTILFILNTISKDMLADSIPLTLKAGQENGEIIINETYQEMYASVKVIVFDTMRGLTDILDMTKEGREGIVTFTDNQKGALVSPKKNVETKKLEE